MRVVQCSVSCCRTVHYDLYFIYTQDFFPWACLIFPSCIFQAVVETREMFVMVRNVQSYPSSREWDTHIEVLRSAAFWLVYWNEFAEELGILTWSNHPCDSVQGRDGIEPPEGNINAVASLFHTTLTLPACMRGICLALPMADSYLDQVNTCGSEAPLRAAQGWILRCLDVAGYFSTMTLHCNSLCQGGRARTSLKASWTWGCKYHCTEGLGCWRSPVVERAQALTWCISESFAPTQSLFLLLSWRFYKLPCCLILAHRVAFKSVIANLLWPSRSITSLPA